VQFHDTIPALCGMMPLACLLYAQFFLLESAHASPLPHSFILSFPSSILFLLLLLHLPTHPPNTSIYPSISHHLHHQIEADAAPRNNNLSHMRVRRSLHGGHRAAAAAAAAANPCQNLRRRKGIWQQASDLHTYAYCAECTRSAMAAAGAALQHV
jgi:hypothetical protein